MGYILQAIIGDAELLRKNCPADNRVVPLPQGKALIPLCGDVLEDNEIPFLALTDEGTKEIASSITEFVSFLIGRGSFAYVEAECFGGAGAQACVTWDADGISSAPHIAPNAINTALRFLGVKIGDAHDEFDALGLGRHRDTSDWLAELTS